MPSFRNSKEKFWYEFDLKKNQNPDIYSEISNAILFEPNKESFYNLCKNFENITLNSAKFKDGSAVFHYKDIDNAINYLKRFCEINHITEFENLLDIIHELYPLAYDKNDRRIAGVVIKKDEISGIRIGTYYNFNKIPDIIWEKIKSKALLKLK